MRNFVEGRKTVLSSPFSRKAARVWIAITLASLTSFGCGPEKKEEISAETSGYMPADKKGGVASAKPAGGTPEKDAKVAADASTTNAAAPVPPAVASSDSAPGSKDPAMPAAPTPPEFELGKIDPKIAAREFMTLKLPESLTDAETLKTYIAKNSRSMRELLAEANRQTLPSDEALKRGMELGRDKVKAADALAKIAADDEQKSLAALSKLEALAQMTSMGDILSSDDLRDFASKLTSSELPQIAEQAAALLLALSIGDLEKGTTTPEAVIATIEKSLEAKTLGAPTLSSITGAIEALEAKTEKPQLELAQKVEAKFRDSKDTSLSMTSWKLLAQRTPSLDALTQALEPGSETAMKPEEIEAKVQQVLKDLPSQWTSFFIASQSTNVEYSGRIEAAKVLIKTVESQLDSLPPSENIKELKATCENFWKRVDVLGKELDLSGLVDTEGKPFQIDDYKGKVVVLDFWATWCGPCLEEIPSMRKLLETRKEQGVEVVGINVDEDRTRLDAFLSTEKLPWKTFVSGNPEKKAFETEAVARLGINAIPFIAILGKDGKVAAIHTRGRALDTKVAELVGAP
ncbi:Thiol-disulfide oxidoreductase ResA [Pirellula sp. SH-Sr6A]|uniref:TlpA family protein disulfide reductase n=1 Tax=Pirellula sp. SH-Sr6A TaxID=1632865 RepID=UPI00078DDBE7|nr:TlpA disulfide reductase family protein [Pirellula sp. SH-Sr6A]AMV34635.1 Thiol-disulfide oxidoreductase ResA [Pirellula sp. SH-Sr6A]